MNDSEVLHTERRAGKGESSFSSECYLLQAAYIGSYRAPTKGEERGKTRSDRGHVYNEKGVAWRSGTYFLRCVAKEKEVSGEDVVMSRKRPYGEGRCWR